jgi:hypothetical protein
LGSEPTYLLHLNSVAFKFEHTDEDRLPFDTLTIPYQWEVGRYETLPHYR